MCVCIYIYIESDRRIKRRRRRADGFKLGEIVIRDNQMPVRFKPDAEGCS